VPALWQRTGSTLALALASLQSPKLRPSITAEAFHSRFVDSSDANAGRPSAAKVGAGSPLFWGENIHMKISPLVCVLPLFAGVPKGASAKPRLKPGPGDPVATVCRAAISEENCRRPSAAAVKQLRMQDMRQEQAR